MAPVIHCVRHAQGAHNISLEHSNITDPALTEKGYQQCQQFQKKFTDHSRIDLLLASPLRRAIYTALEGFEPVFNTSPDRRLLLLPDLQEYSDFLCDVGVARSVLEREIQEKELPVDASLVSDDWYLKSGRYAPTLEAISLRARDVRCWLKARPEREIVVVTHGGFLHFLTEDWEDSCIGLGTGWMNMEYRTYEFTDSDYNDLGEVDFHGHNATLVETAESRLRRGKTAQPPTRREQQRLFLSGLEGWRAQGLCLSVAEQQAQRPSPT
ncbi:hypothetical protein EYZ11_007706 [Aspergillus tanneri]|uniref:Uncharacterized protein n=1 Tax=Aspergillus tanneri TaxID=1220188 RepID=A0A4V3UNW9_9EURO|nr:uncharacterized protein ATNIH1004_007716 [Aspergillus tanneri]KAA8646289.1 hypothetical protein ATNIH1004_007716 [Aspergillus tanneri]THC92804.1 hypothetical protein EYZ11_007706 [Aspergillus tanneri]